jgi:hypothetical protein
VSFLSGGQAETIYSMPAPGASASAPGAVSVILSGNTTTNPGFQLPALASIWGGMDKLPGKTLGVRARGIFGTPASSPGTWLVGCGLNTTQATKPPAIVLAATGAFTLASPNLSVTNGQWELEFDIVVQSAGTAAGAAANAVLNTGGNFNIGPGNNAATASGIGLMVGNTSITTVNPTVSYWLELYATFSTGPASTQLQCNQFYVVGYN